MKRFYIIANLLRDNQLQLTKEIHQFILEHGGSCGYQANREHGGSSFDASLIPKDTECILVVGGDGTLLQVARKMAEWDMPLIGINTGHVGYLCELEKNTALQGVSRLLAGNHYTIEDRMLLSGSYVSGKNGNEERIERIALNDIVIHRSKMLQVVNLNISVNGEYLNTYSADGIIIATPTGSTAYSMSAGGPIVDPKANLLVVTPICPHTLNSKSIVLGAEAEITIEVETRNSEQEEKMEISFDGDPMGILSPGERIVVKKAQGCTKILKLGSLSFLQRLRKKLQECNW